jgi:CRP-like cAMP-binding protein
MDLDLKSVLLKTRLCKYLDSDELDMLLVYSKIVEFQDKACILQQGKINDGVYVIISGRALITVMVIGAGSIQLAAVESGDFVGDISLVENPINTVSVVSQTLTHCIFLPGAYFRTLVLFSPETKFKIDRAVSEDILFRLKSQHEKITAFMTEAHMTSSSMFGEAMHSLARPKETILKDAGVTEGNIKKLDFFSGLSDADFSLVLQHVELFEAGRHCTLIKEGDKDLACYVILRGAVQSRIKVSHKIAKLSVLSPVSVFCSMTIIDNSASIIDYTTCERVLFFKISEAHLAKIKESKIEVWYYLYDAICQSFAKLEQAANKLDIRLNSELYNR